MGKGRAAKNCSTPVLRSAETMGTLQNVSAGYVGTGLLDGPPKIGTIFGISEGNQIRTKARNSILLPYGNVISPMAEITGPSGRPVPTIPNDSLPDKSEFCNMPNCRRQLTACQESAFSEKTCHSEERSEEAKMCRFLRNYA